jgi:hypothetical protein
MPASYDVVRSTSLAADFIVACRLILRRRMARQALQLLMQRSKCWVDCNMVSGMQDTAK